MTSGVYIRTKDMLIGKKMGRKKSLVKNCIQCGGGISGFGVTNKCKSCVKIGIKFSKEHNRKISQFRKGNITLYYQGMKGKHHSKETREKIRQKLTGRPGRTVSVETRKKLSAVKTGVKIKPHSYKARLKLSMLRLKNPHNWKGGITPTVLLIRHSMKYNEWRQQVFIRDDFTCQKCKGRGYKLEAHHKKPFAKLIQEAKEYLPLLDLYEACILYTPMWDIANGQTLCKKCHRPFRSRTGR